MPLDRSKELIATALPISLLLCVAQTTIQLVRVQQIELTQKFVPDFLVEDFSIQKLGVSVLFVSLNAIYLVWLSQARKRILITYQSRLWVALLPGIAFLTYPYSSDVYLYLHFGQMVLHGVDPYTVAAAEFQSPLSPFLVWSQTSTYGPISQIFFTIATLATPLGPILAVYLFKLCCLLFHVINTRLIWQFTANNLHRNTITLAYLMNPLLLYEQVANAHVDVFLSTTIILLIGCLHQRQFVGAIAALWAGFLTKTLPIIWLPILVSYLVQQRRWRSLGIGLLLSVCTVGVLSRTILPTLTAWKSLLNPGVAGKTARSLHHCLSLWLNFGTHWSADTQQHLLQTFTLLTTIGFALFYSRVALQFQFQNDRAATHLVSGLGWVTLMLLLFATPWIMPWYPSILLPFVALCPHSPLLRLTSLVFCTSIDTIVAGGYGSSWFELCVSLCTVMPPLIAIGLGWHRWGRSAG